METILRSLFGAAVGAALGRFMNFILAGICFFVAWAALFGPPLPESAASETPEWLPAALAAGAGLFGLLFLALALKPGKHD